MDRLQFPTDPNDPQGRPVGSRGGPAGRHSDGHARGAGRDRPRAAGVAVEAALVGALEWLVRIWESSERLSAFDKARPHVSRDTWRSLYNVPSKFPHGVHNGISEMRKRWNDRFIRNTINIAKECARSRLKVFVAVDTDPRFYFNVAPPIGARTKKDIFARPACLIDEVDKFYSFNTCGSYDGRESGVLFCIVELAKPVEKFSGPFRVNCELG